MYKNITSYKYISLIIIPLMFCYTLFLHYLLKMTEGGDLANYHYFAGWVLTTLSPYQYGALAGIAYFYNPLADFINYIMFSRSAYIGAIYFSLIFTVELYL